MEHVEAQLDAAKEREEMTERQPDSPAFCWATELAMTQQPVTLSVMEARDVSAEMQRLHAETESLQARIKTMAEEHADELMVAHLDGRMRAAQPAGAQQPGTAYAELPSYEHQRAIMEAERNASLDEYSRIVLLTSTESMIYERAFTNGWNRHASHGQAPAQAAPAYKDSAFESWYSTYNPAHKSDKQRARDAYAAGMVNHKAQAIPGVQWQCGQQASGFTAPQADSVTAPAAGAVAHTLSDGQIEAMPVWRNFVGLWPESRREIVDAVVDLLAAAPTPLAQAADSVLEDAARLDWLLLHISGAEFRRIGVHYSGNARRADVDAARKQGANHD